MEKDKNMSFDLMGDNLRDKIKYVGEGVSIYPMFKMIHPQNA